MSELEWLEPKTPNEIMNDAINSNDIDSIYVLFSGGKDSVCIADFISQNYPDKFKGVVFTVTGMGAKDTRKFALDYSKKRGWQLFLTWPKPSETYYNYVMKHGFPGGGNHQVVMGYLKYHTWRAFMLDRLNKGEKACFISGVRKKESMARDKKKLYSKSPIDKDGRLIFVKPFLYKNASQLWQYYNENELEKSPVYSWFDKSGECYCGAHAEEWELKMLEKNDPIAFQTVKWLENQIKLYGSKKAHKFNKWGNGPKSIDIENQKTFEDYCGESCQVD